MSPSPCACQWCCAKLTVLMDVATTHPSLAYLNLSADRLQIVTCVACGCYDVIYMELDTGGVPRWSSYNRIPDPDELPDTDHSEDSSEANVESGPELVLSSQPRSPYHASIWGLSGQGSQLGGHPSWVQDAYYPACPCCGKTMGFIGQLDWEDIEDYGEGIFYMFLCPEDRLTATAYQQS